MHVQEIIVGGRHGEAAITLVEKRLSARERDTPEAAARLRDEGVLLRALAGRITPRLVEAGEDERGPWLRMDRIAFPTLADRLAKARGTPLEAAWVERAGCAALASLAELHEAKDVHGALGIVHADISPANIAIDDDGTLAVLLDLELACWRGSAPRDGAFRGTVGYCAPEIARGEAPTVASDLFSIAAALVHAATGVVPREGPSLAAMLAMAAERPLDASQVARAALPRAIAACLAHDALARPLARVVLAQLTKR